MTAPPKRRYTDLARHREASPIPTPPGRWVMGQRWEDLLFCNWPVPVEAVRQFVPTGLEIDTAEGSAWISVVPMYMEDAHFHYLPPLPLISSFPEVNVRTYVRAGGYPGVWFFSLDTESRINVFIARQGFNLPYFYAQVSMERGGWFAFRSARPGGEAALDVDYRPHGDAFVPEEGTLERFLTERYSMYCSGRGGSILRGDIQHAPWQLRRATMDLRRCDIVQADGVALPDSEPVVFFSAATDVILWRPRKV